MHHLIFPLTFYSVIIAEFARDADGEEISRKIYFWDLNSKPVDCQSTRSPRTPYINVATFYFALLDLKSALGAEIKSNGFVCDIMSGRSSIVVS